MSGTIDPESWIVRKTTAQENRAAALALVRMANAAGATRQELADALEACGLKPYIAKPRTDR